MSSQQQVMQEIQKSLDRLCNSIDILKEKQDEANMAIGKIKEAVYDPDQGLYARLRELENWKSTSSKMIWTLFTAVVSLISAFIIKTF